ncbi:tetratricopeptide repeat protein [Roseibium sediminicola]|uniref:Tetratricopeptide repeat protein n=1 Tax=Roseibium sediminicola TaxID=2933272 RepID=A0ABT0GYH6_9HYPH|nr:tetratricopeptide repeat protein [Roseibium sp. CAU 1639]MCK7614499.1 tetratricopeptide repeat protein [Roseibium sp. CAU 1639]
MWVSHRFPVIAVLLVSLSGCQSGSLADLSTYGDKSFTNDDLSNVAYYRDDELLKQGQVQFKAKNYGKAYSIYKKAVEVYPKDPVAWIGYAASADMVGRFDSADQGYRVLAGMIPGRPEYLNNVGYSYLLRGNLMAARRYFLKAYEIDPKNPTTVNNLQLLGNSVSFAKRG